MAKAKKEKPDVVGQLTLTLKAPASEAEIKEEIAKLRAKIAGRRSEIEMLCKAVKHYQDQCSHPGQVTGYNERDGSWGNPCKVCGYSY